MVLAAVAESRMACAIGNREVSRVRNFPTSKSDTSRATVKWAVRIHAVENPGSSGAGGDDGGDDGGAMGGTAGGGCSGGG